MKKKKILQNSRKFMNISLRNCCTLPLEGFDCVVAIKTIINNYSVQKAKKLIALFHNMTI